MPSFEQNRRTPGSPKGSPLERIDTLESKMVLGIKLKSASFFVITRAARTLYKLYEHSYLVLAVLKTGVDLAKT